MLPRSSHKREVRPAMNPSGGSGMDCRSHSTFVFSQQPFLALTPVQVILSSPSFLVASCSLCEDDASWRTLDISLLSFLSCTRSG